MAQVGARISADELALAGTTEHGACNVTNADLRRLPGPIGSVPRYHDPDRHAERFRTQRRPGQHTSMDAILELLALMPSVRAGSPMDEQRTRCQSCTAGR